MRAPPSVRSSIRQFASTSPMSHAVSTTAIMTPDEFLVCDLPEGKAELVRGEVRVTPPAGGRHGVVEARLLTRLTVHVDRNRLGAVLGDAGFELVALPRTVRAPDVSFVRAERLPPDGIRHGFLKLAPDLAVEVLSPSETASLLEEKLDDYRSAGVPLVWVVDPDRRTVMVIAANAPLQWLREGDCLSDERVVPGFSCPVAQLFEGLAR